MDLKPFSISGHSIISHLIGSQESPLPSIVLMNAVVLFVRYIYSFSCLFPCIFFTFSV